MKPRNKLLLWMLAALVAGCASGPENAKQASEEGVAAGKSVEASAKAVEEKEEQAAVDPAPPQKAVAAAPAKPAAAPKKKLNIPTDPNTFLVTSDEKTSAHPYHGRGLNTGFLVNGEEGKEVVVTRGKTYKFKVDTGVQHDFYLTTSSAGWGAGTYTDGVEGQFVYEGEVTFKPSKKTPDLLYYQCRNHKYMGGKILVADKGENVAQLKASVDAKDDAKKGPRRPMGGTVTKGSVSQKIGYADMVMGSGSAKRIEASGNAEAIATLKDARAQVASAKASLKAGKLDEAMEQVNEGLRLMTSASRAITTESEMAGVDHKAQHEELLNSLKTYEGSYERNMKRAAKMKQSVKEKLDEKEYQRLVKEGKALAGKGKYAEANKSLEKAQAMITSVLTGMLHAQTVVYDKSFETPKEEYEFELARLENYEELVPLAVEQKQPSQRALELIDGFVAKAAKIKGEGKDVAAKGDYKMAIMAMQAATSNLQRALRIAGVN